MSTRLLFQRFASFQPSWARFSTAMSRRASRPSTSFVVGRAAAPFHTTTVRQAEWTLSEDQSQAKRNVDYTAGTNLQHEMSPEQASAWQKILAETAAAQAEANPTLDNDSHDESDILEDKKQAVELLRKRLAAAELTEQEARVLLHSSKLWQHPRPQGIKGDPEAPPVGDYTAGLGQLSEEKAQKVLEILESEAAEAEAWQSEDANQKKMRLDKVAAAAAASAEDIPSGDSHDESDILEDRKQAAKFATSKMENLSRG